LEPNEIRLRFAVLSPSSRMSAFVPVSSVVLPGANLGPLGAESPMKSVPLASTSQNFKARGSGTLVASAGAAAAGAAVAVAGRRRQRKAQRFQTGVQVRSHRESSALLKETAAAKKAPDASQVPASSIGDSVIKLAQEAGVNLEVRPWEMMSAIAKDAARGWFVKRAEDRGIAWTESVNFFESNQAELDRNYTELCNPSLEYPSYYTLPFHGYDQGNLNWSAAHELEAATQSMCLGYYDGLTWQDAQEMFRGAAREVIAETWFAARGMSADEQPTEGPKTLLDIGCSGGFSTQEMAKAFPGVEATGVDLSPYYLSVAKFLYPQHRFMHALAEETGLPDESFDVVTLNFLLHELPLDASRATLREACRLLAPGGMIAILDVDPRRLLELPPLRRWAFQVTEPWCKDGEYYALDMEKELKDLGFEAVKLMANDPVNALLVARKAK